MWGWRHGGFLHPFSSLLLGTPHCHVCYHTCTSTVHIIQRCAMYVQGCMCVLQWLCHWRQPRARKQHPRRPANRDVVDRDPVGAVINTRTLVRGAGGQEIVLVQLHLGDGWLQNPYCAGSTPRKLMFWPVRSFCTRLHLDPVCECAFWLGRPPRSETMRSRF